MFSKVKDEYWTKCKIVLTSKRVFLQREIGEEDILPNIFFYLDQIVKIDYHKGFLASSPKIGVILSVPRDRPGSIPKSISIWTCNLCRHNNPLMEGTIKCSECGSRIPPNVLASAEAEAAGTEPDVFVRIRLGFRSGGSSAFYEKFIYTLDRIMSQKSEKLQVPSGPLEARANTPTSFSSEVSSRSVGGLSNIMNRIEITQKETSTQLNSAFEDLDSLIAKASDMVSLISYTNEPFVIFI